MGGLVKHMPRIFLFVIASASFVVNGDVLQQSVPFAAGQFGYHTFRIPAMIKSPDGTLLAFADGRKIKNSDSGNAHMTLRRSFDNGQTWQPLQVVWAEDPNYVGCPSPVVDETTGRVWLFMVHTNGEDTQGEINDGTSIETSTVWNCYSDDNGATWSAPVDVTSSVKDPGRRWDQTGPGNGIQLKEGPRVGRLVIPALGRNIYSDNNGATWTYSTLLPIGTGEGTVVELPYGVLRRNDRASSTDYKSFNRRILCYSYNQGSSWTPLQIADDLICPICQASSIQAKDSAGNRIYLFSNPAALTRTNMTVKVSYDNCYNWPRSKVIYPNASAYSSLCAISNGSYGLLYENGDDGYCYDRITFAKFSYDWLLDSSLFLWDFEEYASGDTIIAQANAIKDARGYGLNGSTTTSLTAVSGSNAHCGETAVRFSGNSSQGVKITDYASKDILDFNSNQNFAVRVVLRTTSHNSGGASGSGVLLSKDVDADTPAWWLRVQDGNIRFFIEDSSSMTASAYGAVTVSDGKWHEVIAYHNADDGTMSVTVDGIVGVPISYVMTGSYGNSGAVCVGSFNDGSKAFVGDIDKIQVYRPIPSRTVDAKDGDLNCDGTVNFNDLLILMDSWLVYE